MKIFGLIILLITGAFGASSQPAWFNNSVAPDTVFTGYNNVLRYNAPQCGGKVTFSCTGGTMLIVGEDYVVIPQMSTKVVTVNMYCANNKEKAVATRMFTVTPLSKDRAEKLRALQNSKKEK